MKFVKIAAFAVLGVFAACGAMAGGADVLVEAGPALSMFVDVSMWSVVPVPADVVADPVAAVSAVVPMVADPVGASSMTAQVTASLVCDPVAVLGSGVSDAVPLAPDIMA